jgi:hypothetical protein
MAGLIDRSSFSNINGDDSGVNATGSAGAHSSQSFANNRGDPTDQVDASKDTDDEIIVALVRRAAADLPGSISVSVPEKIVSSGKPFSFPIPAEVVEAAGGDRLTARGMDGKRLPTWLKYSSESNTFSANSVPSGAMPMEVLVSTNSRRWTMGLTERSGH